MTTKRAIDGDALTLDRFLLPARATDDQRRQMFRLIVGAVDAVTYFKGRIEVVAGEDALTINRLR